MMFLKNHCTDFMFLVIMLCGTYPSIKLFLIIFDFPLVFKLSLLFVENYVYRLNCDFFHKFQQNG